MRKKLSPAKQHARAIAFLKAVDGWRKVDEAEGPSGPRDPSQISSIRLQFPGWIAATREVAWLAEDLCEIAEGESEKCLEQLSLALFWRFAWGLEVEPELLGQAIGVAVEILDDAERARPKAGRGGAAGAVRRVLDAKSLEDKAQAYLGAAIHAGHRVTARELMGKLGLKSTSQVHTLPVWKRYQEGLKANRKRPVAVSSRAVERYAPGVDTFSKRSNRTAADRAKRGAETD